MNSQVFDHTSLIRFIQAAFGRALPRRSRRAKHHALAQGRERRSHQRPSTSRRRTPRPCGCRRRQATRRRSNSPPRQLRPRAAGASVPAAAGARRASRSRAIPYEMAGAPAVTSAQTVDITFATTGTGRPSSTRCARRARSRRPRSYTVEPGKNLADSWAASRPALRSLTVLARPTASSAASRATCVLGGTGLHVREAYLPVGLGRSAPVARQRRLERARECPASPTPTRVFHVEICAATGADENASPVALLATRGWYDLDVTDDPEHARATACSSPAIVENGTRVDHRSR